MNESPRLAAGAEEQVPLSAEKVWAVIGDFANIRRWAPAILAERIEKDGADTVRVISMPPDGREVREALHAQASLSYTYRYIGETANARNYYGTVAVEPVSAEASLIRLSSRFDPGQDLTEAEAVGNMTRSAKGNLKAMKRALGLA
jgi:hypothetical protein